MDYGLWTTGYGILSTMGYGLWTMGQGLGTIDVIAHLRALLVPFPARRQCREDRRT